MSGGLGDLLASIPAAPEPLSTWTWGVVTGVSPLRVRLDGDDDPLDITPVALTTVAVDDRVWCQLHGTSSKQLIVLGRVV